MMLSDSALAEAAQTAGMTAIMRDGRTRWYGSLREGATGVDLAETWLLTQTASWLRSMVSAQADGEVHRRYYEGAQCLAPITMWTGIAFVADDVCVALCMHALGRWELDYARAVLGLAYPVSAESEPPPQLAPSQ